MNKPINQDSKIDIGPANDFSQKAKMSEKEPKKIIRLTVVVERKIQC